MLGTYLMTFQPFVQFELSVVLVLVYRACVGHKTEIYSVHVSVSWSWKAESLRCC